MLRFSTTTLIALAIGVLPIAALAEKPTTDRQANEPVVVAVVEDALPRTAPPVARSESKAEARTERSAARGSSQSAAGFRFTSPYAVPQQTLPVNFPSIGGFGF